MKKQSKLLKATWFLLSFFLVANAAYAASLTDVNLEIQAWTLTIWAPSLLQFPDTTVRNVPQIAILTATWAYNATWTSSYDSASYINGNGYNTGATTYSADLSWNPNLFFWVEDLVANDEWWHTQLTISDLTASGATVKTITKDKIDARVPDWVVTKLASNDPTPSQMNIRPWALSWSTIWWEQALTVLTRTWSTNWVVWKYWFLPEFAIRVPAYQALGSYTWVLSYTINAGGPTN